MDDKNFNHSQDITNRLNQVLALAQDINRKTEFCVFFSYSGHTNQIDIHITRSKVKYSEDISNRKTIYLSYKEEDVVENLNKLDRELAKILNEFAIKEPKFEL